MKSRSGGGARSTKSDSGSGGSKKQKASSGGSDPVITLTDDNFGTPGFCVATWQSPPTANSSASRPPLTTCTLLTCR